MCWAHGAASSSPLFKAKYTDIMQNLFNMKSAKSIFLWLLPLDHLRAPTLPIPVNWGSNEQCKNHICSFCLISGKGHQEAWLFLNFATFCTLVWKFTALDDACMTKCSFPWSVLNIYKLGFDILLFVCIMSRVCRKSKVGLVVSAWQPCFNQEKS